MVERDEIDVLLHAPGKGARNVKAQRTTTVGELMGREGLATDELLAFDDVSDDDDGTDDDVNLAPIAADVALGKLAAGRTATIHCHRCRQVAISVNYQSQTLERRFPPSARVRRVLRWAKRKLRLTDADADNLALFLCGATDDPVREGVHVGDLTSGRDCDVCFVLSKDRNIEGAA